MVTLVHKAEDLTPTTAGTSPTTPNAATRLNFELQKGNACMLFVLGATIAYIYGLVPL